MELSRKALELKERYLRFGITDSQLERYKNLGVITEDEFNYIKNSREMTEYVQIYTKIIT